MPRTDAPLYAFNRGEISKIALSRIDVDKLRLAAEAQINFMPWVIGPMMLRPGMAYIGEVLDDVACRLIPFIFSKLDTALLELTTLGMRVWINEQLVTRPTVSTVVGDPNLTGAGGFWTTSNTTAGASVSFGAVSGIGSSGTGAMLSCPPVGGLAQIQQTLSIPSNSRNLEHGLRVTIANGPVTLRMGSAAGGSDLIAQTVIDTGTHCLAFTPPGASATLQIESADAWNKSIASVTLDPPGALVVPTPWTQTTLPTLRWDQSGDIVFVAAYGQQQQKIERRALHSWSIALYRSSDGPFNATPGITANLTPSVMYGNGTLTSDRPWFQPGHVGALFRLFSNGQSNQAVLGNQNAYTEPVRVSGVGTAARNFTWTISGTYVGQLTQQRSYDGPDTGFTDFATETSGFTGPINSSTGGTSGVPDLDNIIMWERFGFKAGAYTSGTATVVSSYQGDGGFGICRVTGYVSPTVVNIEVLQPFSSLAATTDWVESQWSNASSAVGFPTSVAFHEGRLGWFGQDYMWLSASDDFTSFATIDSQGNDVGDAGPIIYEMGSGPVDSISWGLSLLRLLLGREQSVASARSSSFDEPLTASNISIKDCATQGAERLPAVKIDKRGIFVQQSGVRVFELAYNAMEMDYNAHDLTRLNIDIGQPGFVDIAVQRQPDTYVHLVRADGTVAVLLYDPEDEVECWWRITTQGAVQNVAVLPGSAADDLVYYVVQRNVGGGPRRFIERLAPRENCVGGLINQNADCFSSYSGAAVSTVTAPQLADTQVVVWADGASLGPAIADAAGNVKMPDGQAHANIVVGLGGGIFLGQMAETRDPGGDIALPPLYNIGLGGGLDLNAPGGALQTQTFAGPSATLTIPPLYAGAPAEVFADTTGLGKLTRIGTLTVAPGGLITLPNNATAVTIAAIAGFAGLFQSAKLAYASQSGTALTKRKRVTDIGIVGFDMAQGALSFGPDLSRLDPMPVYERGAAVAGSAFWSEYDEPMIAFPGSWDTDARLVLTAAAPNPVKIGAVVIALEEVDG